MVEDTQDVTETTISSKQNTTTTKKVLSNMDLDLTTSSSLLNTTTCVVESVLPKTAENSKQKGKFTKRKDQSLAYQPYGTPGSSHQNSPGSRTQH
ncbi:1142_t:CDS:2 [Ambispora leptoticha]|uniref:1142_t:CDS:1 n=1 Tax=Ambispora leptoticha TaxID=144679 RepID=A0A9N9G9P8_9GLOM|nr:1142_t:CDS:2 [Ambispora leptoticha]